MHNMSSIGPASEQDEPEPDSPSEYKPLPAACFGIDVVCDDARWHPHIAYIQTWLGELGVVLGLPSHGEVSVRLTDDPLRVRNALSLPCKESYLYRSPYTTSTRVNRTTV